MDELNLSEWLAGLFSAEATETQQIARNAGAVLLAIVVGLLAKALLAAGPLGRRIDSLFSSPRHEEAERPVVSPGTARFRPVSIYGWLLALTVVAGGFWLVAYWHDLADAKAFLKSLVRNAWTLAATALVAALAARLIARSLASMIERPPLSGALDGLVPATPKTREGFSHTVADAAILTVYSAVFLIAAVGVTELLGWNLTSGSLASLWQLGVRVIAAGIVLLLGWVGLHWMMSHHEETPGEPELQPWTGLESGATPPLRPPHHDTKQDTEASGTGLRISIAAVTVILAILTFNVFLVGSGTGILALVILIIVIVAYRDHLAEAGAGIYLTLKDVKLITFRGEPATIRKRGLFTSEWIQGGRIIRIPNRVVMNTITGGIHTEAKEKPAAEEPPEEEEEPSP